MTQLKITDDLDALLGVLPGNIVEAVHKANDYDNLLEIILDLGRVPTARYVQGETVLIQRKLRAPNLTTSSSASASLMPITVPVSNAPCIASPACAIGADILSG